MQTLEFPGHGLDSQYLFAVMAYPNDDHAQGELLSVGWAHHFSEGLPDDSTVTLPVELVKNLSGHDAYATVLDRAAHLTAKGEMAGSLLVNLARLKLSGHHEPSLNQAIKLTSKYYGGTKNIKGESPTFSRPIFLKLFDEYRPVIHLWAAYNICQISGSANFIENFAIHQPDNMVKFLGIAEWFKTFAESFTPTRQPIKRVRKKQLIPANMLYALDGSYPITTPTITWGSMDDWMNKELCRNK